MLAPSAQKEWTCFMFFPRLVSFSLPSLRCFGTERKISPKRSVARFGLLRPALLRRSFFWVFFRSNLILAPVSTHLASDRTFSGAFDGWRDDPICDAVRLWI